MEGHVSRRLRIPPATPTGGRTDRPTHPAACVSSRPRRLPVATPRGGDALSPAVGGLSPRAPRSSRSAPHGPQTYRWHAGCS